MRKNQKIVLKIGGVEIFKDWVKTRDLGDELALRYQLKSSLKRVLSDRDI